MNHSFNIEVARISKSRRTYFKRLFSTNWIEKIKNLGGKLMDYRKIYIEKFGEIPQEFEIHHIDLNRENNLLNNLVAIPKELHKEYHKLVQNIENDKINFIPNLITNGYGNQEIIDKLNKLEFILNKFSYYLNLKNRNDF